MEFHFTSLHIFFVYNYYDQESVYTEHGWCYQILLQFRRENGFLLMQL